MLYASGSQAMMVGDPHNQNKTQFRDLNTTIILIKYMVWRPKSDCPRPTCWETLLFDKKLKANLLAEKLPLEVLTLCVSKCWWNWPLNLIPNHLVNVALQLMHSADVVSSSLSRAHLSNENCEWKMLHRLDVTLQLLLLTHAYNVFIIFHTRQPFKIDTSLTSTQAHSLSDVPWHKVVCGVVTLV